MTTMLVILLFLGVPALLLTLWIISLCRYLSARKKNKENPGAVPPEDLKLRKVLFILSSAVGGLVIGTELGLVILFFVGLAYM